MKEKIVAVIGSSGLIGGSILSILENDSEFAEIRLLVRKDLNIIHPKVKTIVVDFTNKADISAAISGCDTAFCAIGTTQKKVKGNKSDYRKIDFDIPVTVAQCCIAVGCMSFALVSSLGANSASRNFYLQLKGEVEDTVSALNFQRLVIVRPSLLIGHRKEFRLAELVGKWLMIPLSIILPTKMRAIRAEVVANAMVKAIKQTAQAKEVLYYDEMKHFIVSR